MSLRPALPKARYIVESKRGGVNIRIGKVSFRIRQMLQDLAANGETINSRIFSKLSSVSMKKNY